MTWQHGDWLDLDTAPRDGTWIIIDVETGGDGSEPLVGRWKPYEEDGLTYEWQVVSASWREEVRAPADVFNHYPEGRVFGWLPLPTPDQ